jgi:hypothetical protein
MKKYIKEIIIAIIQLFMFYIYPLFTGETDAIGMVFIIITATLLLSFIIGGISSNWIKFLYPLATAIVFIPSVFIYYNESALVHSIWYFVISSLGLIAGAIIKKSKPIKKDKES